MIKKISVDKLRKGVYIHDFKAPWIKHPFLWHRGLIKNDKMLFKLQTSGITEVLIDTTKGLDILEVPPKEEIKKYFESEWDQVVERIPTFTKPVTLREELHRAKEIKNEATTVIEEVEQDLKSGKKLEVKKVDNVTEKIIESITRNQNALLTLMNIKEKDEFTFMHSIRSSVLVSVFGQYLEIDHEELKKIAMGALLHDIGKIRIPLEILNKPGKLTLEEFEIVKKHTTYGFEILSSIDDLPEEVARIAYEHHEQYDGLGYPQGLKRDQIYKGTQMVALVNVYDTLISETIYSKAKEPVKALKTIYDLIDFFFERTLAEQFIKSMGVYPVGTMVQLSNGLLAVVIATNHNKPLRPVVRIIYDPRWKIFIAPYDVDLGSDETDNLQIQSTVPPLKWKIDPYKYLELPEL